ncbi:MAG: hypothetical protein AB1705_26580 [Verrucomicrobiota bacterium]
MSTEVAAPPPIPGDQTTPTISVDAPTAAGSEQNPYVAMVGSESQALFEDGEGNITVKNGLDFLQRAVAVYDEMATTKHDDSPEWPPMTDLSLLVKYRVLRALPEAPPGQKFVYDTKTRKVTLASK